jgi:hypothetical protein
MQVIIYFMDLFAKEFPLQESPEGSPLLKNPYRQTLARSPVDTGECFGFFCNVKLPKKKRGGMGSSGADTKELSGDIVNDLIRQAIVKSLHTEDMTKIGKKNTLETMIYNAMTLINANILLIVYYQRLEKLRPRNETAEITQELINLKCGLKMILAVILGRDTEDFYGLFKLTREDKCKMANFEKFSDYYTWDALYKEVVKGT